MRRYVLIILTWCLAVLLLSLTVGGSSLKSHGPISISGNGEFTAENGVVKGNGTKDNPYVISGWLIEGGNPGIYIHNTDKFFVIRSVEVSGSKVGIRFSNVKNGTIENTVIVGSEEKGINVSSSETIIIQGNEIRWGDKTGIDIEGESKDIRLLDNKIANNYTAIDASGYKINKLTIARNEIMENPVGITIDEAYMVLVIKNEIESSGQTAIDIQGKVHIKVVNNIVKDSRHGIDTNARDVKIEENEVTGNRQGITIKRQVTEVVGNMVSKNWIGILVNSYGNFIHLNAILDNETGISVKSDGNSIHHNNFMRNRKSAQSSGANWWDDGAEGNYWDDYQGSDPDGDGVGNQPYTIPGDTKKDRFPLIKPVPEIKE